MKSESSCEENRYFSIIQLSTTAFIVKNLALFLFISNIFSFESSPLFETLINENSFGF